MRKLLAGFCWMAVVCSAGSAACFAESLDAVLTRMDRDSSHFHSVGADVTMAEFTAVLDDTTTDTGTLQMQRLPNGETRAILDFPGRKIAFLGKKLGIYYPKTNLYQEYDKALKSKNVLNQFLLLGFGTSGKDLANAYNISLEEEEKVAGQPTSKLLLVPKDSSVKDRIQKVEIWVPADSGTPVQQQFYEPSGNYRRVSYTNLKVNQGIQGTLELKLPPGVERQKQ